jgi:hypothetical protein
MDQLESHHVVAFPGSSGATHADIQFLAFASWAASPDALVVQVGTRGGMPVCACIDKGMLIREIRVVTQQQQNVVPCGDYSVFDPPAHGRIVRSAASPALLKLSAWVDDAAKRRALRQAANGAVHLQFASCSARDLNAALIVMQHVLKWDVLFGSLGGLRTTAPNPHACANLFDATLARVADAVTARESNATRIKQLTTVYSLVMLPEVESLGAAAVDDGATVDAAMGATVDAAAAAVRGAV